MLYAVIVVPGYVLSFTNQISDYISKGIRNVNIIKGCLPSQPLDQNVFSIFPSLFCFFIRMFVHRRRIVDKISGK